MAREVVFHGKIIVHPGAEVYTDLTGMIQPGTDETRVAATLGEAPFGQPGVVHAFADGEAARQYFGASDLTDSIRLLFEPSNDERVDGGAVIVYAYKANRTTQSERWLVSNPELGTFPDATGSPANNLVLGASLREDATSTTDTVPAKLIIPQPSSPNNYAVNEFSYLVVEILSGPGKKQQFQIGDTYEDPLNAAQYILELRSDLNWTVLPFNTTMASTFRIAIPQRKLMANDWGTRGNQISVEHGRQASQESYEMQVRLNNRIVVQQEPFGGLRAPTFHIKFDPTGGGTYIEWSNPLNWAVPQALETTTPVEGITQAKSQTVLDGAALTLTANSHEDRWVVITGPQQTGRSTPGASFPGTGGGSGTWTSGGSTVDLSTLTGASAVDDTYNGWIVSVTADNGTNVEYRKVTDYDGTSKILTIEGTFTFASAASTALNDVILYPPVANPYLGKTYKILSHTDSTAPNEAFDDVVGGWSLGGGTITLPGTANAANDFYNGWTIRLTNDNGSSFQFLKVTDYDGTTKVATVNGTWTFAPSGTATNNDILLIFPPNSVTLVGNGLGSVPPTPLLEWKVLQLTDAYLEVDGRNGKAETLRVLLRDTHSSPVVQTLTTLNLDDYDTLKDLEDFLDGLSGVEATIGNGVDENLSPGRFDFGPLSDHYGRLIESRLSASVNSGATSLVLDRGDDFPDPSTIGDYFVYINPGLSTEEKVLATGLAADTLTVNAIGSAHAANSEVRFIRGSNLILGPGDADNPGPPLKDNNAKTGDFIARSIGLFSSVRATGPGSGQPAPGLTTSLTNWQNLIGSAQAEDDLDLFKRFYGGLAGTSRVTKPVNTTEPGYPTSWQHGLDELVKLRDIRVVTAAASEDKSGWASGDIDVFQDMFRSHLLDSEDNRSERQGYLGRALPLEAGTFGGIIYPRGLLETIKLLNEERMSLVGQQTRVFSSFGDERVLPPWAFACQAAGIQMGTDIGEPLTLKFIKTAELLQPFNDWDPRAFIDLKKAIQGGLLFGEPELGRWRIVRGFTTHIATNNLARTDINVWEIRNRLQRLMRREMEARFGGVGVGTRAEGVLSAAPATVSGIRDHVGTVLNKEREEGIIIDSQDEQGRDVNAWTGLAVRIDGDVARIKVQVFPKTGLNFILIDFAFQLPSLAA